jgi:hypothetical protein
VPLVGFYALGQPTVTLCTGDPFACRRVVTAVEEIDVADADGAPVLVLVEGGEGGQPPLTAESRLFWSNVDFTTGAPGWLPPP